MTNAAEVGPQKLRGVTLALGGAFPLVAMVTIMPVMPQMAVHYASTPESTLLTGFVLVVSPLAAALSSSFIGRLVDRFGGMRAYIAALCVVTFFGGLGYFMAPLYGLIGSRAMVGIGMAGLSAATGALFAQLFTNRAREGWLAMQAAFMSLGSILFAPLAGFVAEGDWRRVFLIVPLGIWLLPMIILSKFGSAPKNKRIAIDTAHTSFPVKKVRIISAVNFCCLILSFAVVHPVGFLIAERGYHSTTLTGVAIAMNAIGGAVGSAGFGFSPALRIASRLRIGLLAAILAYAGLLLPGWIGVFVAMFMMGIAVGFFLPSIVAWAISSVRPQQAGRCVGIIMTTTFFAQFGGMPLAALTANRLGSFNSGMAFLSAFLVLGLLLTFLWKIDSNAIAPQSS